MLSYLLVDIDGLENLNSGTDRGLVCYTNVYEVATAPLRITRIAGGGIHRTATRRGVCAPRCPRRLKPLLRGRGRRHEARTSNSCCASRGKAC
jgi:hypothetical protein